jgi:hypothetical protein
MLGKKYRESIGELFKLNLAHAIGFVHGSFGGWGARIEVGLSCLVKIESS